MNTKLIDAIANAVLYEGYMLYPYRASSVKNRQRFNFGVLYPRSYSEAQFGSDAWSTQTEFLVEGISLTAIEIRVRFLRLVARSVHKLAEPLPDQPPGSASGFESVLKLEVDGNVLQPWQEAVESDVVVPSCNLAALTENPLEWNFSLPAKEETEFLHDANGEKVGKIARKQDAVCGVVEVTATCVRDSLFKVQARVKNLASLDHDEAQASRDQALMRSLVSAHILLGVVDGQFVSLLEPPEHLKGFAVSCNNLGVWPVLVGAEGERNTMLASPVILYDYPQIAPESPGDLFDGTEIDEILALRIMTMTDDEKREMRNTDERARKILERTESLPMEHLARLHGTLRELRSLKEEAP
ncbi:MAG: hypothetical protein NVS1B11_07570 [Terriglobales bacterium]